MLTKRELGKIRKQLPQDGYERIASLAFKSAEAVKKVLREPDRYNKDVIDKALIVVEQYKLEVEEQKAKVKVL
jgi:hypothetical protein